MRKFKLREHNCDAQMNWGANDDTRLHLTEGVTYDVTEVEVHSMHTKLHINGNRFNSVCFEEVE